MIKIELISTLFFSEPFSLFSITIPIYLLGILIDFTLNCLIYNDDIVSQKYNNNGKLSFYTSLILLFLILLLFNYEKMGTWLNYSFTFEYIGFDVKN